MNSGGGEMIRAGTSSLDSGNNVHWSFGEATPVAPTIVGVFQSSMSVTWGDVAYNTGYVLEVEVELLADFVHPHRSGHTQAAVAIAVLPEPPALSTPWMRPSS